MIRALGSLVRAVARELSWGLRGASVEIARWRAVAERIPDDALRRDALDGLGRKRANVDGAVLFSTLPRARSQDLLQLLVAYEVLADFLDCTSERGAYIGLRNGLQLHRALVEALDPQLDVSDYFRYHPWQDDGGYTRALVDTCRAACVRLPSYGVARPLIMSAAGLTRVLAINHVEDPRLRDDLLKTWAASSPGPNEIEWFEWAGGASAWLTILALLALAADPGLRYHDAHAAFRAYLPWISLAGTMLDSYGDATEDAASCAHSYIAHYASADAAISRLIELVRRALTEAAMLPNGSRHEVLAGCMVAMYLSKDSTRRPEARGSTRALLRSAGPLMRLLVPVLRLWRVLNHQQAS